MLIAGSTSVSVPILVRDTTSTTGAGLGSLTHETANLVAEYRREGQSSWTAITLAAGTLGTWSSGGFVADGSLTGAYELGLPNAAVAEASGVRWVAVRLRGAANMLAAPLLIPLMPSKVTPIDVDGDTYTEYMQAIIDALSGLSGSGAYLVTVTVKDEDNNLLQNAIVRMSEGAHTWTAITNVSGVALLSLDAATYTMTITKPGYNYAPSSRVVDGAETFAEEMTPNTVTPAANPAQTNAHLVTRDGGGSVQGGVTHDFRRVGIPDDAGHSYPGAVFSATSDSVTGYLEVLLAQAVDYQTRRNHEGVKGPWVNFTTGSEGTYLIPFYGLGASDPK